MADESSRHFDSSHFAACGRELEQQNLLPRVTSARLLVRGARGSPIQGEYFGSGSVEMIIFFLIFFFLLLFWEGGVCVCGVGEKSSLGLARFSSEMAERVCFLPSFLLSAMACLFILSEQMEEEEWFRSLNITVSKERLIS